MGSSQTRRRRAWLFERLEDRCVMAAATPDFWIDSWLERDLDTLTGHVEQTIAAAHGLTGWTQVRNDYGFIGTGQTVAVIDSGIAWDHYALGGGFGPNYRVVGGWDFTERNNGNPYDRGPYGGHGTHVAGIVGADRPGTASDGVAPGVDLVSLRVFNDAGQGYFTWVKNALNWVFNNRNAFANPITAVNLSLGTAWNSASIPSWAMLEEEFARLKSAGIFISVAAGNAFASYGTPGLSYPAASPHVVPVMSVDSAGAMSPFSQRLGRAIAAPGQHIVSTVPDYLGNRNGVTDDFASFSGTSMAAPYVAGASVLVREAMHFVGYVNVTQDTIYNHMLATAATFFDSATGQYYKRLDLGRAIDALMPADDYGSTVATAHNLGAISGTRQISGLIGKTSDVDYFRFTAAATGSVSFTATTTHNLAPVWTAHGGTGAVSGPGGRTFTIDVVAGQSYTVGLATSAGIGYYNLAIKAQSSVAYAELGTITQTSLRNINHASETWYRLRASRTGYLTTEALFASAGGNVNIALYDANQRLIASGRAAPGGGRLDVMATAGSEYLVRVTGTNANLHLRFTNAVSHSGTTVNIVGTAAADTFSLAVGARQHTVSVNGVAYQFKSSAAKQINFAGGAGSDSITMTGTSKAETAVLRVGHATFKGSGFAATATGIEHVTVRGGGGKDTVHLYDSPGDDVYRAYANHVVMTGAGYSHTAVGFGTTFAYASTGTNTVHIHAAAAKDVYRAFPDRVVMSGRGYSNTAVGFGATFAYAAPGNSRAFLYDSRGNDTVQVYSDRVVMSGSGYSNTASGFKSTFAYASAGSDVAHVYNFDSPTTSVSRTSSRIIVSGAGYRHTVERFGTAFGHSSLGNQMTRMDLRPDDASEARARFDILAPHFADAAIALPPVAAAWSRAVERIATPRSMETESPASRAWADYESSERDTTRDEELMPWVASDEDANARETLDTLFDSLATWLEPIDYFKAAASRM